MLIRVLSAIVLLLICVPIFIIGGNLFNILIYVLSLIGLHEFISVKEHKKQIPLFIKTICYIALTFVIFSNVQGNSLIFSIDYRVLTGIFSLFLIPTVLYHDRKKYSINDAFYMIGGVLFLGISFSLIILIRNISLEMIVYLLLISTITDTYAYITGMYIGKHKLLKEISPNKTLEGMFGGILFGVFIPVMYYITIINPSFNIYLLIIITLFLSILGQIGDLCFSAIKRYYKKKDFSNIIPGHGGILDRFDSIIFIVLGFVFFVNIIGG